VLVYSNNIEHPGIGTIIGLVKIKIPISGNFEKFNKNKSRLKKYSYIH
jgi:hypothetical protein